MTLSNSSEFTGGRGGRILICRGRAALRGARDVAFIVFMQNRTRTASHRAFAQPVFVNAFRQDYKESQQVNVYVPERVVLIFFPQVEQLYMSDAKVARKYLSYMLSSKASLMLCQKHEMPPLAHSNHFSRTIGTDQLPPRMSTAPPAEPTMEWLESRTGVAAPEAADVAEALRTQKREGIEVVVESKLEWYQKRLGLSRAQVEKMAASFPSLIQYSVEDNIEPKLRWLQGRYVFLRLFSVGVTIRSAADFTIFCLCSVLLYAFQPCRLQGAIYFTIW